MEEEDIRDRLIKEIVKEEFGRNKLSYPRDVFSEEFDSADNREKAAYIDIALKTLTRKQSMVVFLRIWKNLSQQQIANLLHLSQSEVSGLLNRGINKIAKTLRIKISKKDVRDAMSSAKKTGHYLLMDALFCETSAENEYSITILEKERCQMKIPEHIAVVERDGGSCVMCGNKNLNYGQYVHVIDERKSNKDVENLCLMCQSCHVYVHNISILSPAEQEIFDSILAESRERNIYKKI